MVVEFFCTPMIDVENEFGLLAYTYFTSNASYLGLMFYVQYRHDQENFEVTTLRDSDSNAKLEVPCLTRRLPHGVVGQWIFKVAVRMFVKDEVQNIPKKVYKWTHGRNKDISMSWLSVSCDPRNRNSGKVS
ncbi:UDP-glucuronosyl/UDP-glucosyltransferase protein [Raphanus sativus]|nr:UDP-glucuronosyl/UDP-glucosyltransferase protein [Raphanus sativus]